MSHPASVPVVMALDAVVAGQLGQVAVAIEELGDLFVADAEGVVVAGRADNREAVAPFLAFVDRHTIHAQHVPVQAEFEALMAEAMNPFSQVGLRSGFDVPDRINLGGQIDGRPLDVLTVRGREMIA